jgi:hypothetical protein
MLASGVMDFRQPIFGAPAKPALGLQQHHERNEDPEAPRGARLWAGTAGLIALTRLDRERPAIP